MSNGRAMSFLIASIAAKFPALLLRIRLPSSTKIFSKSLGLSRITFRFSITQ